MTNSFHFQLFLIFFFMNSEASARGVLLSFGPLAVNLGHVIVNLLASFQSWRQVTLIISILPVIIVVAICFVRMTFDSVPSFFNNLLEFFQNFLDSRNPQLVVIKRSSKRCTTIFTMVARMGRSRYSA